MNRWVDVHVNLPAIVTQRPSFKHPCPLLPNSNVPCTTPWLISCRRRAAPSASRRALAWLRMVLPFALDHINLWLLHDRIDGRDGWTVADTCIDHPESRAAWAQVFANELDGLPILRVLVTHYAPRPRRPGAPAVREVGRPAVDERHRLHGRAPRLPGRQQLWRRAAGRLLSQPRHDGCGRFGADPQPQERATAAWCPRCRRATHACSMARPSPLAARWCCIAGYGHAPEHMALYCEAAGILISGDMVLPRISTNVSACTRWSPRPMR